jgi:N-acetylglucosamine-6-phosphate deacetylase
MGYVDLQVNGFGGVDFNVDNLSTRDVARMCKSLRSCGVDGILATIITDDIDAMCRRITAIQRVCVDDPLAADVIWGIHIEGPFLNQQAGYIGAHSPSAVLRADPILMERLLAAASGMIRLVTLAPERDDKYTVITMLADRGIRVAAGHCDPTLDQLHGAIEAGLTMFTHLGNGCPLHLHRHDNIIQRVLSCASDLWIGFIADGIHIPFPALNNYLRLAGIQHSFVVTDAIHAAGLGPGTYEFRGKRVVVDDELATWDEGRSHLTGSASTMPRLVHNLRSQLGLAADAIDLLTSTTPRLLLGRR